MLAFLLSFPSFLFFIFGDGIFAVYRVHKSEEEGKNKIVHDSEVDPAIVYLNLDDKGDDDTDIAMASVNLPGVNIESP